MKCFYHSADLDGHCSGAIVKHFFPACELIGYNYGQEFPWDTISKPEVIYMVDVSLPIEQMFELGERCGKLNWIDHHISAIKAHDEIAERRGSGGIHGLRRTDRAACELVWEFLHDVNKIPFIVELLGVYDSWRFKPEDEAFVKKFQYGMRLTKETRPEKAMEFWEKLFPLTLHDDVFDQIFFRGSTIYDYQLTQNEKSCRSCAFETELPGDPEGAPLRCIAINSNLMNSDVFKSVWDPTKYDAMLCFYRSNRGFWRCSIYSDKPEIDCSVWAKIYGGGGHKGAAGFKCSELPFYLGMKANAFDEADESDGADDFSRPARGRFWCGGRRTEAGRRRFGMKWIVVKRNYHGEEAEAMRRWVVGVEGQTRGICECWDENSAQKIAFFLNIAPAMYRQIADALNNWYPLSELECSEKECAVRGRLFEFFSNLAKNGCGSDISGSRE